MKKVKYKSGTPCPSHEYYPNVFGDKYAILEDRGFIVGCHGENISTYFNHPFKGEKVDTQILEDFGIASVPALKLKWSLRKWIMKKLSHRIRRKLRYWFNEKLYNWVRG